LNSNLLGDYGMSFKNKKPSPNRILVSSNQTSSVNNTSSNLLQRVHSDPNISSSSNSNSINSAPIQGIYILIV
jgi:hypothetical protein